MLLFFVFSKQTVQITVKNAPEVAPGSAVNRYHYLFIACWTATATATVMPTMGLLPAPRKPIIST